MKTLFRAVVFGVAIWGMGAAPLRADEALRRVQQSLRDQGFYYGPTDGSPGDETNQAVRRYQIRNGLPVTGQLDDETKRSIEQTGNSVPPAASNRNGGGAGERTAPARPNPPPNRAASSPAYQRPTVRPLPEDDRRDDAREGDEPGPIPRPQERNARPDLRGGPGPLPPSSDDGGGLPRNAVLPSARLSALFAGTPFEFAPPPVQADVLKRAQGILTREGFYDGAVNGAPSELTTDALTNFQGVNRLRKTGRLDVSTLGTMRLLPGRQALAPQGREDDEGPHRGPNIIFEGRIAR